MKMRYPLAAAALVALGLGSVRAEDAARSLQVKNLLRVEYDDNIYDQPDKEDSFKVYDEVEFLANLNLRQTFLGARWRPTFVYWESRDEDHNDFNNDLELVLNHTFSPRATLSLKDTFRLAQQPEQVDRGVAIRNRDDYMYNVADGSFSYALKPATRLEVGVRDTTLRYDRDETAELQDYDILAAGVTLRHEFNPSTALAGDVRYEQTDYVNGDRGSESQYIGAGLDQVFSPSLIGTFRLGAQFKQFDSSAIDNQTAPYLDTSLTLLPSPRTRLTGGLGYSMFESDYYPYANQDRTMAYVSASHDLTALITLYAAVSYQLSQYDANQAVEPTVSGEAIKDGSEDVVQLSARATYKVNRNNFIELGFNRIDVNSDMQGREDYDRNRVNLGWRTQI